MKISLAQNQWFDGQGYPLVAGRVSVYLHGSDTLATIYTMEGENYVQAANPVTLDADGRSDTVWFDAAVVDVTVEGYLGREGAYWVVDTYQDGFAIPGTSQDTFVVGLDGLAQADPALGSVGVIGYNSANDCGVRYFVWDPSCTVNEDGGSIVASAIYDTGRWILLSDSRYMPSSWYGVFPLSESNMGAFLTYPATVGQWNIKLPPVPRFQAGTYTSAGILSTPKSIAFDSGAKFTNASFVCRSAEVTATNSFVADFTFTDQATAESSWFRSVTAFWGCGARELHQCLTNYFVDSAFNSGRTVSSQRITGRAITMSGTGVLSIMKCDVAPGALSTHWFTRFSGMSVSDRMFADADWDFGIWPTHHTDCRPAINTVELANFDSPNPYILWAAANGVTRLDLQGRVGALVTADMPFTEIVNGHFTAIARTTDTLLENVVADSLALGAANFRMIRTTATITYCQSPSIIARLCTLALGIDLDTIVTGLNLRDTDIAMNGHKIGPSNTDDYLFHNAIDARECSFVGGYIYSNNLFMKGCEVADTPIYIYPYHDGAEWKLGVNACDNIFAGSSGIHIGANCGDGAENPAIYNVGVQNIHISRNLFNTTNSGVTMPFWAGDMQHRFLKGIAVDLGWLTGDDSSGRTVWGYKVAYNNNEGNCPGSFGDGEQDFNNLWHAINFDGNTQDSSKHIYFTNHAKTVSVFCVPVTVDDGGSFNADNEWEIATTAKAVTPYAPRYTGFGHSAGSIATPFAFPYIMYTPLCAWDKTLENDAFKVVLGGSYNHVFDGAIPIPAAQ